MQRLQINDYVSLVIVSGAVNLVRQWVSDFWWSSDNCWSHTQSRSVLSS